VRAQNISVSVAEGLGVAKLVEPAVCRPGVSYVVCLRCKVSVGVENRGSSLRLTYDLNDWKRRDCCCLYMDGPVTCCWFSELRRAIGYLGITH
jgi:hypothetical protein